jgi:hypothetical protein
MKTLQSELLRLQNLVRTGVISKDEYQQVLRERRGLTLQPSGRLAAKRNWIGTEVNGERATPASQGTQRGHSRSVKLWKGKPAPEITAWNAMVKADRILIAAGQRSVLVKVIKGVPSPTIADTVSSTTIAELRAMVAASTVE